MIGNKHDFVIKVLREVLILSCLDLANFNEFDPSIESCSTPETDLLKLSKTACPMPVG